MNLHATVHQPDTITLQLNGLDEGEFDLVVEMGLPDGTVPLAVGLGGGRGGGRR